MSPAETSCDSGSEYEYEESTSGSDSEDQDFDRAEVESEAGCLDDADGVDSEHDGPAGVKKDFGGAVPGMINISEFKVLTDQMRSHKVKDATSSLEEIARDLLREGHHDGNRRPVEYYRESLRTINKSKHVGKTYSKATLEAVDRVLKQWQLYAVFKWCCYHAYTDLSRYCRAIL